MYVYNSIMSPRLWVTQYFRKINILNNQNAILIFNKKNKMNRALSIPAVLQISPNPLHPLQAHNKRAR